ncbi:hypothetical protein ACFUVV_03620 [Streptomyces sp. NPDC057376]|uniref:hypothetical protein n=1 Tax=unclassified Streptomyces TaxID=2593676 RepID=UPI0009A0E31E|nr:hypothetical protein [Streptomyces sp. CB02414]
MLKLLRRSRRVWVAALAVMCAAGITATAALTSSPAPDPQPDRREETVSAECAEYIADVERQLDKAQEEGQDEGLVFTRTRVGADDCGDELRDHFVVSAEADPKPRPAPPRVYSSCLAVDTVPVPAGGDPCDGR